ncbi:hypothetical protein VB711_25650 [Cronbergia sp. UHCC 0137]|uniref:hypothetical protein n=1 Tax=Cronbergia sp. UHCC 0137 TaxID=3110239 RepID=UPI002B20A1C5|nr:hypothetical protein [Cronbergia sp. UHCC 0137]MEA5621193.1 hypothetical protein [Cronbergia sp. UHCC 0137]
MKLKTVHIAEAIALFNHVPEVKKAAIKATAKLAIPKAKIRIRRIIYLTIVNTY